MDLKVECILAELMVLMYLILTASRPILFSHNCDYKHKDNGETAEIGQKQWKSHIIKFNN